MKIELKEITVRELAKGYEDNAEGGIVGYDGKLDIRPPYQREFIYKDKQRDAVINTVTKDFPLNVMYWSVREDGNYEVIDGQQRTISLCQYVNKDFSIDGLAFHNLKKDKQEGIYTYVLTRKEKFLNLRAFDDRQKRAAYERQKGVCPVCKKKWKIEEMEADHITPWHEGGKTIPKNCRMLCKDDNRTKSGK